MACRDVFEVLESDVAGGGYKAGSLYLRESDAEAALAKRKSEVRYQMSGLTDREFSLTFYCEDHQRENSDE